MLKVICVDDERQALQQMLSLCADNPDIGDVRGFSKPRDALNWVQHHACDLALLDIQMPGMDGIMLAGKIQEAQPETSIVFVTRHPQYSVDAWSIHVQGYLLKPVTAERLREETKYFLSLCQPEAQPAAHIEIRTFGGFDVLVDGKPVHFQRSKAKELLACLVEKRGRSISREELHSILWDDRHYDRPAQKQLDVMLRSLRVTLDEYGIGEILSMQRGAIRIEPRTFSCDLYRLLLGDVDAVNEYRGEYMAGYSWASLQEAYLNRQTENLSGAGG